MRHDICDQSPRHDIPKGLQRRDSKDCQRHIVLQFRRFVTKSRLLGDLLLELVWQRPAYASFIYVGFPTWFRMRMLSAFREAPMERSKSFFAFVDRHPNLRTAVLATYIMVSCLLLVALAWG
jgi:hypothetical protein